MSSHSLNLDLDEKVNSKEPLSALVINRSGRNHFAPYVKMRENPSHCTQFRAKSIIFFPCFQVENMSIE